MHVQRVRQPPPARGDLRVRVDLDVDRVDVAELQQVDHPPAVAGDREPLVARALGQPEQVVRRLRAAPARCPAPTATSGGRPARSRARAGRRRWRASSTASLLSSARRSRASEKLSSIASRAEQPGAQRRVVVADRLERLLEQRDELLVDDPARHLARRAVAERGLGEQLRRAERARDVGRVAERRRARRRVSPALFWASPQASSSRQRRSASPGACSSAPQRDLVQPRRLLVGEHGGGAAGRRARRTRPPSAPRAPAAPARSGGPARPAALAAVELLERLGDAQVQPRAARRGEPVVEGLADQRVGEAAAPVHAGHLGDHVRAHALLDHLVELVLVERRRPPRAPRRGTRGPSPRRWSAACRRARTASPAGGRSPRGCPRAARAATPSRCRPVVRGRAAEVAHHLLEEERVALGLLPQRAVDVLGHALRPELADQRRWRPPRRARSARSARRSARGAAARACRPAPPGARCRGSWPRSAAATRRPRGPAGAASAASACRPSAGRRARAPPAGCARDVVEDLGDGVEQPVALLLLGAAGRARRRPPAPGSRGRARRRTARASAPTCSGARAT